jgi:hypothetical protein
VSDVGEADAARHPSQFLGHERVGEVITAQSAVGLGNGDTHHVERGEFVEDVTRELVAIFYILSPGGDLRLTELPNRVPGHPVFLGEVEIHTILMAGQRP